MRWFAAVEAKNLKWAIAFIFRGMPEVQHAWKLVHEQGLIGTVLEVRGRGKEDHRAGGEDLIVLGAHVLDLMVYFMRGMPEWCDAHVTDGGRVVTPANVREAHEPLGPIVGDRVHAMYAYKGGAVAYFDSMKNPEGNGGRFGIDIYGSRGVVSIRVLPDDLAVRVNWFEGSLWAPGGKGGGWKPLPDAPLVQVKDKHRERNQIITDDLIAAIEEDRRPAISVQDGLASWELTQAVFESCVQGGRVAIPLKDRSHPLKRWGDKSGSVNSHGGCCGMKPIRRRRFLETCGASLAGASLLGGTAPAGSAEPGDGRRTFVSGREDGRFVDTAGFIQNYLKENPPKLAFDPTMDAGRGRFGATGSERR